MATQALAKAELHVTEMTSDREYQTVEAPLRRTYSIEPSSGKGLFPMALFARDSQPTDNEDPRRDTSLDHPRWSTRLVTRSPSTTTAITSTVCDVVATPLRWVL